MRHGGEAPEQIGSGSLAQHVPLRSSEFAHVKSRGERFAGRCAVISLVPAPDGATRLGIVVSRRFSTKAVRRNRARRLIRESFRLLRNGFHKPVWIVIIARKHLSRCKLQDLQAELLSTFGKAGLMNLEPPQ